MSRSMHRNYKLMTLIIIMIRTLIIRASERVKLYKIVTLSHFLKIHFFHCRFYHLFYCMCNNSVGNFGMGPYYINIPLKPFQSVKIMNTLSNKQIFILETHGCINIAVLLSLPCFPTQLRENYYVMIMIKIAFYNIQKLFGDPTQYLPEVDSSKAIQLVCEIGLFKYFPGQ